MRGEESKRAVREIREHARYAITSSACQRALDKDTAEGYTQALKEIVNGPNRSSEYAVNIDKAKRALREDG